MRRLGEEGGEALQRKGGVSMVLVGQAGMAGTVVVGRLSHRRHHPRICTRRRRGGRVEEAVSVRVVTEVRRISGSGDSGDLIRLI